MAELEIEFRPARLKMLCFQFPCHLLEGEWPAWEARMRIRAPARAQLTPWVFRDLREMAVVPSSTHSRLFKHGSRGFGWGGACWAE